MFKSVLKWFDNDLNAYRVCDESIDWVRCIPFIFVHIMCFGVIFVGVSKAAVVIAVLSYVIRMFAITGFYHRYFSHRTYKTSRFVQFIFAFIGGTAVQRGAIWWAAHHRAHHKYSDSAEDVHSPHTNGFFSSHVRWFLEKRNFSYDESVVSDLLKYPELVFLNRFDILPPILYAIFLFVLGNTLHGFGYNCSGTQVLIWGFFVATTLLYHGTFSINSLAHIFGKRVYPTKDKSKNNWWLAILTLGEGWHNNHHYWPSSIRQGFRIYEIDITYYVLKIMHLFNLVHSFRLPPQRIVDGRISQLGTGPK